jgi:hypothetical protein
VQFSRLVLFSWEREPPRPKAVASSFVTLNRRCSGKRESPRDKPVASLLIMLMTNNRKIMGSRVNTFWLNVLGWITTVAIFAASVGLVVTWFM